MNETEQNQLPVIPGTWAIVHDSSLFGAVRIVEDGMTVADVYTDIPGGLSNAHLIEAAPKLAEALELALATIKRLSTQHGPINSAQGTIDVATKALKRACLL